MLSEVEAVGFRPHQPSRFSSGWASPVYIDRRALISYPRVRRERIRFAERTVTRAVGFERFDVVAGGETAAIPFAAWLAEALMLPLASVETFLDDAICWSAAHGGPRRSTTGAAPTRREHPGAALTRR
jgi:orotate phosphoribosyltransferase